MIRRAAVTLALALAAGLLTPATTLSQPAPVEINVIVPATGPAAFLGSEEAKGYGVVADVVNKAGGIKGRR